MAVLSLLTAAVLGGATAATAGYTNLCTGYDSCNLAGMPHAGYKEASGSMYWGMDAGHNCTNYVAYRMVRNGMANTRPWVGTGMAYNWGRANPSKTNSTPAVGSVAWWDSNVSPALDSGHVAYVERVISADEIIISEDNWDGDFHWTRITRSGAGWPSGFIHFNDVPTVGEGSAVRASDNGEVYVIAGGAPVYLSTWAAVGGERPVINVSRAELNAMRQYPADGTLITAGGMVYRFAGGAPVYVSSWSAIGGTQPTIAIDLAAVSNADGASPWNHVHRYPADGTFVSVAAGYVYRFVGGAPIYVSSWAAFGGPVPTTLVDQAAIDRADGTEPWSHVRRFPASGTFLRSSTGHVYRVVGGAPVYVSTWTAVGGERPVTTIDQAAIDNADKPSPWNHLRWYPADGSVLRSGATGLHSAISGGLPRLTASIAGAVVVDPAAMANRGTGGVWNHLRADPATHFSDVPTNSPFAADIRWLSGQQITTGFPDGGFHPGTAVTRDAMAAFLYRLSGSPAFTAPTTSPFNDVATSHPFYRPITWLAARGISTGTPTANGTAFKPGDRVSREAMAAFLYRHAGSPAYTPPSTSPFIDVPTTSPLYKAIAWLSAQGISTGTVTPAGREFNPSGPVTREAMAAFLHRYAT